MLIRKPAIEYAFITIHGLLHITIRAEGTRGKYVSLAQAGPRPQIWDCPCSPKVCDSGCLEAAVHDRRQRVETVSSPAVSIHRVVDGQDRNLVTYKCIPQSRRSSGPVAYAL